jgi:hypothetical protein
MQMRVATEIQLRPTAGYAQPSRRAKGQGELVRLVTERQIGDHRHA